jgi:hypothetical protein
MKKTSRLALAAGAGALALAFTGSAFAAYSPKLFVRTTTGAAGAGSGVTIDVRVGATDDPTAAVSIYVPNGYQLNSPAAGTDIGDVDATASAADLAGAVLPLKGDLLVVAPATYATLQAQCGVAVVAATWDLHLTAAGQTLDVPVFVVATAGAEQAIGQYKLVICLPPPDVPAGTPGRATFGAKLLTAKFNSTAFTNPTATGEYRWRSLWTPYVPSAGVVNRAGTVEAQAVVFFPTQLALAAKKTVKHVKVKGKLKPVTIVSVTATLTQNGAGLAGTRVSILGNGKLLKTIATNASGKVTITGTVTGKLVFTAKATLADRDLGTAGCTQSFPPVPCIDATVAGQALTGRNSVTVIAARR